ncbi:MAG: ornithine cyclodeaminase family protein, partial [Gordonia amarae]
MGTVEVLSAADIDALITPTEAVDAICDALVSGSVDPELDDPRLFSPAPGGEFLLMPARGRAAAGVKVLTVAPDNPARGKPKIQGVYVLVDSADLAPRALLDGPELTLIRTPAVTVLAIRELLAAGPPQPPGPLPMVVYGTGPQARRHVQTMRSVLGPIDAAVIGRRPGAITEFIGETTRPGLAVRAGTPADVPGAAVVLAATSSPTPVVDAALIGPH